MPFTHNCVSTLLPFPEQKSLGAVRAQSAEQQAAWGSEGGERRGWKRGRRGGRGGRGGGRRRGRKTKSSVLARGVIEEGQRRP